MIEPDANLVASIRARLDNQARASGQNFEDILYRFAIERFLYRLSQSHYQDQFVLKGAQVVAAWGIPLGRPTRDIDLKGFTHNAIEHLEEIVRTICEQPVEPDGITFDPESVAGEEIAEAAEYAGARILFWGRLGRARVRMQVDIGFSDVITPGAIQVEYPTLLGMPVPVMRGYPPETVISEKLQAIVYLGELNSRMKDFYDLWLLSRRFDFDGEIIREAISITFRNRDTLFPSETPAALTDAFAVQKQAMWRSGFLQKLKSFPEELVDFQQVIGQLRTFLLPPLLACARGEGFSMSWDPVEQMWKKK